MSESIRTVKERYESYLIKISGVKGIGYDQTHIIIYVEKLTTQLASFLPRNLDGVPVKVIITGQVTPLR